MLKELVTKNRSYRRFDQTSRISEDQILSWVELARLSASGANLQPLKYFVSTDEKLNALVFPTLAWAGYLKDWDGPIEGERPAAYIVILGDLEISKNFGVDHGIASQSILLGAVEEGYGGCILANIKRDALREVLHLDSQYEILLVLALGKPVETVKLAAVPPDGSIKYWRDEKGVHFVPKRTLSDILVEVSK
jgi:nitroreductase